MKKPANFFPKGLLLLTVFLTLGCDDDFLDRTPLDTTTLETFWKTPEQAEMWVNNLYKGLGGVEEARFEAFSDNAFGRAGAGANNIANGLLDTNDPRVSEYWNYRYIRLGLEFFDYIENVPGISESKKKELTGQVRFMLAYQYYRLMTLYRDVPLVTKVLEIDESDVEKNSKEEILAYVIQQLDEAIALLPVSWPASESGRITRGAALALKARVLLYNERWAEASQAAKAVMDLNEYTLHPNFKELFLAEFNNRTREVILAKQYAESVQVHDLVRTYAPVYLGGYALVLPTNELQQSFGMKDGSPFDSSNPEHMKKPFSDRDPRFNETFMYHGKDYNGVKLDLTGSEFRFAFTYLYYLKYVADLKNNFWPSHVNWILFRYADVLLMYAEATNEVSGADPSVFDALDQIRTRAGMPAVDRKKYAGKEALREFIRNERRVELAGEGLRYFDIRRWRIGEQVLNTSLKSMDLTQWTDAPRDGNGKPVLVIKPVQSRVFNSKRHYVWPIPQTAIDKATKLTQHSEW
jgi:hypothetical protein